MPNAVIDLDKVNDRLEDASPTEVVEWSHATFGQGLVMSSSFGVQAAVMLHLATQVVPDIPVIFIDTGFHFPQTYTFCEELTQRLGLNLKVYQSDISPARMVALYGQLWEGNADDLMRYNRIRKVEPMARARRELGATCSLAGVRKEQTDTRAGFRRVAQLQGIYQAHPILHWSNKDVHDYSSRPLTAEDVNARDTRFRGLKQECGLHLPETEAESESRDSSGL